MNTSNPRTLNVPGLAWYSMTAVAPNLMRITEPHVHPLLRANIWWIRGNRDIVIDAGLGVVPLRSAIPEMFDRDPLLIVTHAHLDHSGGAYEFDEIAIHENEAKDLENPSPASLETHELYASLGMPMDVKASEQRMLEKLPDPDYQLDQYQRQPARATRWLRDGDVIRTGQSEQLEIIEGPGHSPGSICILDRTRRWLFTGDVLYKGQILDDIHGSNRADYVKTMQKIQNLPLEKAFPGHGGILDHQQVHAIASAYVSKHQRDNRPDYPGIIG